MRNDILERENEIRQWIIEQRPKAFICKELHCKPDTLNSYLKKMNIEYAGNQGGKGYKVNSTTYKTAQEYINTCNSIKSHKLLQKLIKDGLREDCCEICGLTFWQGKHLPLELHHKDRNHFNNDLNNLIILCPNCHSIQDGNSGANVGFYAELAKQEEAIDLDSIE